MTQEGNSDAGFGALAGLRVLDLTRVLGGPYCTQLLGDHGAEIIKVEPPQGDEVRDWGPPFHDDDASYFIGVNRNKRSIGLDLRQEAGRAVLLRLLERADVLIENYKPGALEKWGLGYHDTLKARFPQLIHCRISGFGAEGPLGGFPGYDAAIQACAGLFSINGTAASGPTRMGTPLVDIGTGLFSAVAVLMAVIERSRSGLGQYIDMALYDSAIALLHPHAANYFLSGKLSGLTGNQHPNIAPYDKFSTANGEVFLAVGNDRAFQRLCQELGKPELSQDSRFTGNPERSVNREALTQELAALLKDVDGKALCDRLLRVGVPAAPVQNIGEVMEHPHTLERQMNVRQGTYQGTGMPIKFSRTPGKIGRTPPKFAEHAQEILAESGFAATEIEALRRDGVVVTTRRK